MSGLRLERLESWPGTKVLAWDGDTLYAGRGYALIRHRLGEAGADWEPVARYGPPAWRTLTSSCRLSARLFRDGFGALAVLPSGALVASVPGALLRLEPGRSAFEEVLRTRPGRRPMSFAVTPEGRVYWGEYSRNTRREEVRVYGSADEGRSWEIVHTFAAGEIRHVHNIVHDPWGDCLWTLTGDEGAECRVLRSDLRFGKLETVLSGNQQARAVALLPAEDALIFASDTPLERNHVYRMTRAGELSRLGEISSSVFYGCRAGKGMFFTTAAEPSAVNTSREVGLYGSADGARWTRLETWRKDGWPMPYFQYGTVFLPSGRNGTSLLAATCVGVRADDLATVLWRVEESS